MKTKSQSQIYVPKSFLLGLLVPCFLSGCVAKQASEIEQALLNEDFSGSYELVVDQRADGIHLDGFVASDADRLKIVSIAKENAGHRKVYSEIEVRPQQTAVKLLPPAVPSDAEILAAVQRVVGEERRKLDAQLKVERLDVNNGAVSIRGDTSNFRTVDALLARIRTVDGVRDVHSSLTINGKPYMAMWQKESR
ncbi:MAG: BON domain-containing protein [Bdellovibrionales bacterium]|nr:BON domain-containing protein [Bdellovibrionales bacterium]